MQEAIQTLQRDLTTATAEVKNLSDANEELSRANDDLTLRLALLKDSSSDDENKRQKQFDEVIADVQSELTRVEQTRRAAEGERDELKKKCADLEELLAAAQDSVSTADSASSELEQARRAAEGERDELKKKCADLEGLLAAAEGAASIAASQREDTVQDLENRVRAGESATTKPEETRSAPVPSPLEDDMRVLREAMASLEQDKRHLEEELEGLHSGTQAAAVAHNQEVDHLKKQVQDALSVNEDLSAHIAQLEEELRNAMHHAGEYMHSLAWCCDTANAQATCTPVI